MVTISWYDDKGFPVSPRYAGVGGICRHPDGYLVKIVSGEYEVDHRISNFWYWKKLLPNGNESWETYHGYGW